MDMTGLLKQAKKMQKELEKKEKELQSKVYSSSVGGAVKVEMNGSYEVLKLDLNKDVLSETSKEELEEMLVLAMNDVLNKVNKDKEEVMGNMTGGIKFPGVF